MELALSQGVERQVWESNKADLGLESRYLARSLESRHGIWPQTTYGTPNLQQYAHNSLLGTVSNFMIRHRLAKAHM